MRASILALLEAAQEGAKWAAAVADVGRAALEAGIPALYGGRSRAPFDFLGDSLRGTKGIMMDMYRRPDKLQEALERLTPIIVDRTVEAANASGSPVVTITLHKGPGGFMSGKQFETFYWPSLRKVMLGLIEEGLVPMPFAEGDYMPRLDVIKDMPRGSTVWYFEAVDMAKAKEIVGKDNCIAGNLAVVPSLHGNARGRQRGLPQAYRGVRARGRLHIGGCGRHRRRQSRQSPCHDGGGEGIRRLRMRRPGQGYRRRRMPGKH